jgi:hypothetical protein
VTWVRTLGFPNTVASAVSRSFRMSRYCLADWNAMFDAINYTTSGICKSNGILFCIMYYVIHGYIFVHWAWSVTLKGRPLAEVTVLAMQLRRKSEDWRFISMFKIDIQSKIIYTGIIIITLFAKQQWHSILFTAGLTVAKWLSLH